jgi:DNA-3-methyladenine glycosylase II
LQKRILSARRRLRRQAQIADNARVMANPPPYYWEEAAGELARRDAALRLLIARHGDSAPHSRGDAFATLARALVCQQLSVRAADAIWGRMINALGEATPRNAAGASDGTLRACGLSSPKCRYLRALADYFMRRPPTANHFAQMGDEEVVAELTAIPGVGEWTAQMFLMFYLLRPDVLPVGDVGLRRAMNDAYNNGEPLSGEEILILGERWRPWRTAACWYLWRSRDATPVNY